MTVKLKSILPKKSGRSWGSVVVRHQGGRHKRFLRKIDFLRDKRDIWGVVEAIEYDPNRNARIAKILYEDGERRYILCPDGVSVSQRVIASEEAPLNAGNALPLSKIPAGSAIHNIEIRPGRGAQLVKSAGSVAQLQGKEDEYVQIKLPSGELRRIKSECYVTLGQVSNPEFRARRLGKAGIARRMGRRPTVRGVAMHPGAHPHGGGEGRSGVGLKYPKTYTGRPAVGRTRKKGKYSDKAIITRRKPGKHS
ncbi:MAG: 50S ribosomal protein L2 [Candidatus Woesebacteria bacterium GW2011_GWB1_43_14]|uniref:50S ribosomal protein L2 n=1 Tax=Candidatus Woesebacteria bacterium GW2011_GWB1_43_14 TaxID=1618578 RepID=A0A0G1FQT5_9BACT|nr:MAG: 50S ribosomal protein L2 [Candidatus Woesebacteria bacterium GW2011_GWA1_39_11b]KKS78019.1 MAG: 50S ribosomal protein L2 [Candidatus Woesebacteria bacterium GW2011_GWC1_42_9]KKS97401.1 MAG: 50S ribosomal protein L2 [Candidatus Woesebacteria bacterium GW2011_GWB1_43_14]